MGSGGSEGGVSHPSFSYPSTSQGTCFHQQLRPQFHQGAGSGGGDRVSCGEGSSGAGSPFAGVLQPSICGVKGFGSLAPHHRPVLPEQVCGGDQVPDGNRPVGSVFGEAGRLDGITGLEGCLPSSSSSSGKQTLPPVFHLGGSLSVPSIVFRTEDLPSSLHTSDGSGVSYFTRHGNQNAEVSGRLVSPGLIQGRVSSCEGHGFRIMSGTEYCRESRKVSVDSNPVSHLPGDDIGLQEFEDFSHAREGLENVDLGRRISILKKSTRVVVEESVRSSFVPDSISSGRSPQNEVPPTGPSSPMEFSERRGPSILGQEMLSGPPLVAGDREDFTRLFSSSGRPGHDVLVRRVRRRVGRSLGRGPCFRPLGRGRSETFDKFEGTQSSSLGATALSSSAGRSSCCRLHGQFDGGSLSQETGGNSVTIPESGSTGGPQVGRVLGHLSETSVHSGQTQCSGGRLVTSEPGDRLGMDTVSGSGGQASEVLAGECRSVRHLPQFSSSGLFCPSERPAECGDGRTPASMGRPSSLRFSAVLHGETGPQQVEDLRQHGIDFDRSVLASEGVVPGLAGVLSGTAPSVARAERSSQTAPLSSFSSGAPVATSSCLETIQRFARHEGFSRRVAKQVSFARRSSTRLVYQAKWNKYRRWCREKGHSVSRPTLPKIADFLLFLFKDLNLSVSCVRGYRSVLSVVFRWKLPDLQTSPVIRDLIRSFSIQRPRGGLSPPCWDLVKVLVALRSPPFEPLGEATFKDLTKKTLFLLALASAKRVGELQALSSRVAWVGGDMAVSYVSDFVAKTESEQNPIPRSFLIKSLKEFVGELEQDYWLCPVRAVKYYIQATKDIVSRPRTLFVSPKCRQRSLSKNAMSFFLRDTISGAGALRADVGQGLRAHSIRGVGTSLAFTKNWSMKHILKAATWRSNTVFTSFYLKDVAYEWDDCRSLGSFVAAGQVINHPNQS